MKTIKLLISFVFFCLFIFHSYSQDKYQFIDNPKAIENVLSKKIANSELGGTLTILYKGKVIFNNSYGVENLSNKIKVDSNSQFYIASVGKTFTSAAILYLWERNLLNLDDFASKYVKNIRILKKVTIRQLLSHTSGIPDYYDEFGEEVSFLKNENVLEFVKKSELEFKPGSKYSYSNSGYIILSYIIENVSKQSYSSFINDLFLKKLGLNSTIIKDSKDVKIDRQVTGYNTDKKLNDYNNYTYGAGGIYSSQSDMIKWYLAIRDSKFLKKSTWEIAFTPPEIKNVRTYLAMGWNYEDCAPIDKELFSVSSFGSLNGFTSFIFMIPSLDFAVISLSNSGKMLISPYEILEMSFAKK